jgi:phosphatidylethanolamine/phosphatidyl-N-methylethanolamine N-methyltransferase
MSVRIDIDDVRSAYRRHSSFYDFLFGPLFQTSRRQAVEAMACKPGERVLEVGVGTGLSLLLYPPGVRVVGVDLSHEMLEKARPRARQTGAGLAVMDAGQLGFADCSFDKVVAMYVASVVPDPPQLVEEMRRVCRSREGLFFVNHFESPSPLIAAGEKLAAPLAGWLGFRPDFSFDRFVRASRLEVVTRAPAGPFGYWTFLRAR